MTKVREACKYIVRTLEAGSDRRGNTIEVKKALDVLEKVKKQVADVDLADVTWACRKHSVGLGGLAPYVERALYRFAQRKVALQGSLAVRIMKGMSAAPDIPSEPVLKFITVYKNVILKEKIPLADVQLIAVYLRRKGTATLPIQILHLMQFDSAAGVAEVLKVFKGRPKADTCCLFYKRFSQVVLGVGNGDLVGLYQSLRRNFLESKRVAAVMVEAVGKGGLLPQDAAAAAVSFARQRDNYHLALLCPVILPTLPSYNPSSLSLLASAYSQSSEATKTLFDTIADALWTHPNPPPEDIVSLLLSFAACMVTDARETLFKKALRHLPESAKTDDRVRGAFKAAQVALV